MIIHRFSTHNFRFTVLISIYAFCLGLGPGFRFPVSGFRFPVSGSVSGFRFQFLVSAFCLARVSDSRSIHGFWFPIHDSRLFRFTIHDSRPFRFTIYDYDYGFVSDLDSRFTIYGPSDLRFTAFGFHPYSRPSDSRLFLVSALESLHDPGPLRAPGLPCDQGVSPGAQQQRQCHPGAL